MCCGTCFSSPNTFITFSLNTFLKSPDSIIAIMSTFFTLAKLLQNPLNLTTAFSPSAIEVCVFSEKVATIAVKMSAS